MKVTSFKLDEDLKEQADKWCEEHDRTLSYLIRLALKQFLNSDNS